MKLGSGIVDMFPRLRKFTENNNTQISGEVKICIMSHFCSFRSHLENYFPDLDMENYDWIRDRFNKL
jgi:hypothetical protein